ncbi:MAG: hypothetical protein HYS17_11770 [Micavibrio aeruginosavorus]|uniref:Sushi domain-containing protein n=1 Tax=Micavibrio aeruginosavorus TaxID=349221 RepID=A0A7T5R252_9BACT|nr:MAG: hypothetical protein HYS17_11770 [Micavibrio aeruginosavorus]
MKKYIYFSTLCLNILLLASLFATTANAACSGGYVRSPQNDYICESFPAPPPAGPPAPGGSDEKPIPLFPDCKGDDAICFGGGKAATWTDDKTGNTCSSTATVLPNGKCGEHYIGNQYMGAYNGYADFVCIKGTWTKRWGSCEDSKGCSVKLTSSWSGSDSSRCSAQITDDASLVPNGTSITKSNELSDSTGSITFKCDGGNWNRVSSTCTKK